MLPLARYRRAEDPVLLGPEGPIAAGAFFAHAGAIAATLPDAPYAINLCATRSGFMLGFAAALMRGQISLLPPGQSAADWQNLPARYPGAYFLDEKTLGDRPPVANADTGGLSPKVLSEIPPSQVAAILFTSGSTGEPAAHAKTWGQLCRGAELLAEALGWRPGEPLSIIGSVPPQHMFGLESTVVLPWQCGLPVHAHKPLLPADLEAALGDCAEGAWWMTTPLHLRAPLQSGTSMAGLRGVLASTMSLPAALAREAEARWSVPVFELYGSTETGAFATRRTGLTDSWSPLRGVTLSDEGEPDAPRFVARGLHIVAEGVTLADAFDLEADGGFRWLGRSQDLVKVAGKRASLAALDRALLEIPGIVDGAFAFAPSEDAPDESHPARRLAAFYVSTELTPADVATALRPRIDTAFMPRPLLRVAQLPRNANGKLPRAALDNLFALHRPHHIDPGHPALPGHFPGNPIVPGVTVLSRVDRAIREQCPGHAPATLRHARFHAPLRPGETFTIEIRREGEEARFEVRSTGGAAVASGQWQLRKAP